MLTSVVMVVFRSALASVLRRLHGRPQVRRQVSPQVRRQARPYDRPQVRRHDRPQVRPQVRPPVCPQARFYIVGPSPDTYGLFWYDQKLSCRFSGVLRFVLRFVLKFVLTFVLKFVPSVVLRFIVKFVLRSVLSSASGVFIFVLKPNLPSQNHKK
jgi:hypothetical protein